MKEVVDPIVQGQRDAIQQQGMRANEAELNLEENKDRYSKLYESWISKEELARRIIDQWNLADSKDYFSDTNQIQKANSYANFVIQGQITQQQAKQEQHNQEMEIRKTEIKKGDIIKMNDLKNLLQDTPENTKENSELLVSKAKERVKETIDRYTDKIQEIQKANDADKQKLQNELADIQKQLKAEKESYQQARNNFFADISKNFQNFSEKDLKKLPIRLIRYKQKEGLLNKPEGFNSISAIRRRKTIDTLIKKINLIDKDHTKGMNFVLWFHKERFGRYTDIKLNTAVRNIGKNIWLQMNPQQFHEAFNKWRKAINEVLENKNAGLLSPDEEQKVTAIKNRINYYGAAYAQERANARVNPFIQAEKNASNDTKIFQKPTNIAA